MGRNTPEINPGIQEKSLLSSVKWLPIHLLSSDFSILVKLGSVVSQVLLESSLIFDYQVQFSRILMARRVASWQFWEFWWKILFLREGEHVGWLKPTQCELEMNIGSKHSGGSHTPARLRDGARWQAGDGIRWEQDGRGTGLGTDRNNCQMGARSGVIQE